MTTQPRPPAVDIARPQGVSVELTAASHALRDHVVEVLREQIVSGELEPGTRLRERALSEQFGVSRVPVREAILVLEQQRLVITEPRVGATVTSLTARDVTELFDLRLAFEPLTARLAARSRTTEDLAVLDEDHDRATRAATTGDAASGSRANADFHRDLILASHSELLQQVVGPLDSIIQRLFRQTITRHEGDLCRDHAHILEAVRSGDEELAAFWAVRHVESTREHSIALFS
ncbi:GntR family transcriptional regulator [Luteococcus peritonei]|uniref:GntR family transcriptional regulator n=1 Tax=Luteococcus peritonei TaxID=88874 RepID=A0ABW4RWN3_9ACTN